MVGSGCTFCTGVARCDASSTGWGTSLVTALTPRTGRCRSPHSRLFHWARSTVPWRVSSVPRAAASMRTAIEWPPIRRSPNCITGVPSSRLRPFGCGCAIVAPVQRPRAPPALLPRGVVRGDDRLRDRLLFVVEHHGVRAAQRVVPVPRQVDRPRLPWRPGRERLLVGARDGVVDAGLEHGDRAAGHHAPDVPAAGLAAALGPPAHEHGAPTWCPRRLPPRPRSPVLRPPPGPESPRSRGPSAFITTCVTACCNRKPGTHPAVDRQPRP